MGVIDYLDKHFKVKDSILSLGDKTNFNIVSTFIDRMVNIRTDYFGPKVEYLLDRNGLAIIQAMDESIEKINVDALPRNTLFFYGKELCIDGDNKFGVGVKMIGFYNRDEIELEGFVELNKKIYVKDEFKQKPQI
jgi:hypothetical protein